MVELQDMKTLPLTAKDFTWVKMTPKDMQKKADEYIAHKKKVYSEIKKILPEHRTYLNTLYALERCDDTFESYFSKMGLLSEVSPKKEVHFGHQTTTSTPNTSTTKKNQNRSQ
jgi:Zn-dependent oligopeptidase